MPCSLHRGRVFDEYEQRLSQWLMDLRALRKWEAQDRVFR